jgi:hypothetical protein
MLRPTAEMPRGRDALTWLHSRAESSVWFDQVDRFRVGDIEFQCSFQRGSKADRFFIRKHRRLVEEYLDVFDDFPHANVVELGIAEGGSVALTALVAPPKKLVAFELDENRVDALDELIGRLALTERVHPYYGVDQADRTRLRAIIDEEFADEPLDLVIDDASHRLDETRASFETLFPRLRPGGLFLIEDWNQQQLSRVLGEALADPDSPISAEFERRLGEEQTAASKTTLRRREWHSGYRIKLIMELVLAQAESDEFLSEVTVGHLLVGVRRGPGQIDPLTFRLSDLFTDHLGLLPR